MSKVNEQKGWSKESTQNKLCEFKVRAIGLDFSIATWIEKGLKSNGLKDCFEISMLTQKQNIPQNRHPRIHIPSASTEKARARP